MERDFVKIDITLKIDNMLTVKAPAKINLTLEVLKKRPDGYHEIKSVLQAIGLYDTLKLEVAESTTFLYDMPDWSAEKSLLIKAVELLKKATGNVNGVRVEIEKRIPMMAGLGGDSSDAAALLRGLNQLWKLGLKPEELQKLAAQLGSDVPFFLYGGAALAEGRGEKVTPLPPLPRMWAVLVVPDVPREPGKTGRMYASLRSEHYTDGSITRKLVEALHNTTEFNSAMLFNTFENIAFEDNKLHIYIEHLKKLGASHVHLAGSGPTLYTLFTEKAQVEDFRERCKAQGMETYLAATL